MACEAGRRCRVNGGSRRNPTPHRCHKGARPTFTCAPYLLDDAPVFGEAIGWSESNAVIFANTVMGARAPKHPDYLDLFIAMTGRAPASGVYTQEGRIAHRVLGVTPPPAPLEEARRIADLFGERHSNPSTQMIITIGRDTLHAVRSEGIVDRLEQAGVRLIPDLCWCSIVEPIFPPDAKGLFTNSGKYAHYAHGLSGRHSRIGSLEDCVAAAVSGYAPESLPQWLQG